MEPQALKLHKNFDHFKYSLHMNEKNINFGLNILRSLSQVNETPWLKFKFKFKFIKKNWENTK